MPDWMSHLLIGLIISELFNIKKKSLVLLGALAPDLLPKIHLLYIHLNLPSIVSFTPIHTPFMVFLISVLIAPIFRYNRFKTILLFNIGALSHFVSDLSMKHFVIVGTRLFYPITNKNFTLNLIWPDQSIFILFSALIIYVAIRILKKDIKFAFPFII